MPIGFLRQAPKIDIQFDDRQYRAGDEIRVRVVMQTDKPGLKIRRAVLELALENRYTHTRVGNVLDRGAYGSVSPRVPSPMVPSPFTQARFSEERVDRHVMGREELILDGVLRQRTQLFGATFTIKAPPVRRTMERRATYQLLVHMDIPRMRDVEVHKQVQVQIT